MPEDETFENYLAKLRQLYHLGLSQRTQQITELQQTVDQLKKQLAEQNAHVTELEDMTRYATTLDLVTHPTFLVRPDNLIQLANEKILALSHYELSDLLNKPLTDFVRGVEFLDQMRSDPLLMQVEDLDALAHVPVILVTQQGEELPTSAEIHFLTPPRAYHGVRLALKPKEEKTLLQRTRQHVPRYLGGATRYDALDAEKYAQDHQLHVRDKQAENSDPLDGTHLLTAITKRVLELDNPAYTRRGVVINFQTVETCDPRFYQTLFAVSQMNGLPLTCIVYEDSQIHQSLLATGFLEKSIVKEKKKKK